MITYIKVMNLIKLEFKVKQNQKFAFLFQLDTIIRLFYRTPGILDFELFWTLSPKALIVPNKHGGELPTDLLPKPPTLLKRESLL